MPSGLLTSLLRTTDFNRLLERDSVTDFKKEIHNPSTDSEEILRMSPVK